MENASNKTRVYIFFMLFDYKYLKGNGAFVIGSVELKQAMEGTLRILNIRKIPYLPMIGKKMFKEVSKFIQKREKVDYWDSRQIRSKIIF